MQAGAVSCGQSLGGQSGPSLMPSPWQRGGFVGDLHRLRLVQERRGRGTIHVFPIVENDFVYRYMKANENVMKKLENGSQNDNSRYYTILELHENLGM
jgi:hypothetical protein